MATYQIPKMRPEYFDTPDGTSCDGFIESWVVPWFVIYRDGEQLSVGGSHYHHAACAIEEAAAQDAAVAVVHSGDSKSIPAYPHYIVCGKPNGHGYHWDFKVIDYYERIPAGYKIVTRFAEGQGL